VAAAPALITPVVALAAETGNIYENGNITGNRHDIPRGVRYRLKMMAAEYLNPH